MARLDVRERASNTSNAAWAAISDKGSGVVAGPLVNSSDTASTDTANTRWAIYANMAEIVADMDVSMGSGADKWHDIAQRMSRSDTSQWNS